MGIAAMLGGGEFAAHFLQRHALHQDAAGAGEGRKEQAFAPEESGLDPAYELNIVIDRLIESNDTANADLKPFGGTEIELDKVAACVDEDRAGANELFKDEAFTAEEARAEPLDQRDRESDRRLCKEKSIALGKDGLPRGEIDSLDSAGVAARESDFPARRIGTKIRNKERFPCNGAAESAQQFFTERVAAHAGVPGYVRGLVDHFSGFRIDFLAGCQADPGNLEIVALDGEIERRDRLGGSAERRAGYWGSAGTGNSFVTGGSAASSAEFRIICRGRAAIATEGHGESFACRRGAD